MYKVSRRRVAQVGAAALPEQLLGFAATERLKNGKLVIAKRPLTNKQKKSRNKKRNK